MLSSAGTIIDPGASTAPPKRNFYFAKTWLTANSAENKRMSNFPAIIGEIGVSAPGRTAPAQPQTPPPRSRNNLAVKPVAGSPPPSDHTRLSRPQPHADRPHAREHQCVARRQALKRAMQGRAAARSPEREGQPTGVTACLQGGRLTRGMARFSDPRTARPDTPDQRGASPKPSIGLEPMTPSLPWIARWASGFVESRPVWVFGTRGNSGRPARGGRLALACPRNPPKTPPEKPGHYWSLRVKLYRVGAGNGYDLGPRRRSSAGRAPPW